MSDAGHEIISTEPKLKNEVREVEAIRINTKLAEVLGRIPAFKIAKDEAGENAENFAFDVGGWHCDYSQFLKHKGIFLGTNLTIETYNEDHRRVTEMYDVSSRLLPNLPPRVEQFPEQSRDGFDKQTITVDISAPNIVTVTGEKPDEDTQTAVDKWDKLIEEFKAFAEPEAVVDVAHSPTGAFRRLLGKLRPQQKTAT